MNASLDIDLRDGLLLQGDGSAAHAAGRIEPSPMFVVRGGQLTPVADAGAFHLAGHDPADVRVLPDPVLAALPKDAGAPAVQQITLDLDSDLGAGHFMSTHGMLRASPDGSGARVDATTRTRTVTWFGGYHGAVQIIFSDDQGIAIGNTPIQRFGVDGTVIGRSDRTDYWSSTVAPELAARVTKITISHFWDPDIAAAIARAVALATPIVALIMTIAKSGGKSASS